MYLIRKTSFKYIVLVIAILNLNFILAQSSKFNFSKVDSLVNQAIKDSVFPGAVLIISKEGETIYENAYGNFTYNKHSPKVTLNTIYDLASLTKIVATTTAAMICIDENLFHLNDKVTKYIPEFDNNGKEKITIKQLLLHKSGLPAYKRFYKFCSNADEVIKNIYETKLVYKTGTKTVYSDLSMIVLQKVIEKVTGRTLDNFSKEKIFNPLKMKHSMFNPNDSIKYKIAPTELDNYWRYRQLQGEVHDETASQLGGVSGNAGLFSTAEDLSRFLKMILQKGVFNKKRIIKSKTVKHFTTKQQNSERALGWDIKSPKKSSAGNFFSSNSFGHTGYTGTSFWADLKNNLFVIFLTNRVYPSRNNRKIVKFRPVLHDKIIKSIYKTNKKRIQ
ncbi:MAG: serine hydrolase [Bacteroidetes bacterium]|nr:serine hydrolase [Bacteroidota bacterium]